MENIAEALRDIIEHRILPWIERDGISKLLLPEQITPAHCAGEVKPKRSRNTRYRYRDPELAIGLTGKFLHCIDGKVVVVTPGMMVLMPAGTPRRILQTTVRFTESINIDRPSSAMWMRSYPSCVWIQLGRIAGDGNVLDATPQHLLPGRHFSELMTSLLEEVRSRQPYYADVGRSILLEFMQRCLRATTSTASPAVVDIPAVPVRRPSRGKRKGKSVKPDAKQPSSRVQAAREFIHSHYHIPISLEDIADAANLSVNHLGQLYLGGTGGTTGTYNLSGTGVLNAGIVEVGTNWYSGTSDGYFNISGGTVGATSVTLGTAGGTTDAILKVTGSWGAGTDKITFGTYTQTDMGTLVAEINGIETIVVTGAAAFDGNLVITDLGAAAGEYTIMTYASQTGAFTVTLPGNGLWENPVYGDTALTVTKVPEPMTMTLLGLGGIGVLLRRKRR